MIRNRRPRIDDAELIRLIRSELMPLSHTINPHDATELRTLPKRLRSGVTFVIAHNKASIPLGFVHLYIIGDTLQYDMLAIHPTHRGKRWGRVLMKHGEDYGLARGCTRARLFVDEGNDKAHVIYRKLGFVTVQYHPIIRCYEMMKQLSTIT